ncbi:MAG: glycerate kinase [Clostridia bacterium]|nr:glycerate kinase [Clostridia bacterium]
MKVVTAIDSFKGSLSAEGAALAIERGILSVFPEAEVTNFPLADGGEGLVDSILAVRCGEKKTVKVKDPLGREIEGFYGLLSDGTAVIEMAAASGLPLLSQEERNPLKTTSYGTGQLIAAALAAGSRDIILGLGGSATNDGGMGMAEALGIRFLNRVGCVLAGCGENLEQVAAIDDSGRNRQLDGARIRLACDVTNPLCGPTGASHIFGGQKGADSAMRERLDAGMKHYARVLLNKVGKDFSNLSGCGAAGGLMVPLLAFWQAEIFSGIELVLDTLNIDDALQDADLVITGEGRLDGQTLFGKVPIGVAKRSKRFHKPVIALAGSIGEGYRDVYAGGIDAVFSVQNGPMSLEESMENTEGLLADCAHRIMRFYKMIRENS